MNCDEFAEDIFVSDNYLSSFPFVFDVLGRGANRYAMMNVIVFANCCPAGDQAVRVNFCTFTNLDFSANY